MKNRNKNLISLILAVMLIFGAFAVSVSALETDTDKYGGEYVVGEVITTNEYKYIITDEKKGEIILLKAVDPKMDETGTYTIPAIVDGYSVKYIDDNYFEMYSSLYNKFYTKVKKIVISEGIEEFYETGTLSGVMPRLEDLEEVVFPSTFTKINGVVLSNCAKLKKVTLGDNIKSIGDFAFVNCDSLEEIVLPKNLETIGDRIFLHCDNIKTITIDASNKNFVTKNNVLFGLNKNGERTSLIYFAPQKETTKYKVPSTVKTIENGAFSRAKNLVNLTVTENVTSIGESAFGTCENLTKIKLPSKLKTIGDSAFAGCKSLKSVVIPEKVEYLGEYMFDGCYEKIKITIKNPECIIGYVEIPEKATICGYKNSTAQKYAEKHDYKFKSLGTGEKVFNIRVKERGRTYLSLKWNSIKGADKYQIYISTNGKKWTKAGESKTNTFKVRELKASTWYYVKVRAIKDGEKYKFSSVYKTATKPKTPQNVKVSLTKKGNIKVSWDKQSKVAGYKVYYSTDNNFKKNVEFVYATGGNPNSYTFDVSDTLRYNFKEGKTYYFKVTAYKVKEITDINGDYDQEHFESSFSKTVSIKLK